MSDFARDLDDEITTTQAQERADFLRAVITDWTRDHRQYPVAPAIAEAALDALLAHVERLTAEQLPKLGEKSCRRCCETKPSAEFNRNRSRKDGLQSYCRECQKELDRELFARDGGAQKRERTARYVLQNAAGAKVRRAVRSGKLTKPDACERCGDTESVLHGHHEDYSKPLDVIWVCPKCHGTIHEDRPGALEDLLTRLEEAESTAEAAERERNRAQADLAARNLGYGELEREVFVLRIRAEAAEALAERRETAATLARSELDWCIGYASTVEHKAWRERLLKRLHVARAALAHGGDGDGAAT